MYTKIEANSNIIGDTGYLFHAYRFAKYRMRIATERKRGKKMMSRPPKITNGIALMNDEIDTTRYSGLVTSILFWSTSIYKMQATYIVVITITLLVILTLSMTYASCDKSMPEQFQQIGYKPAPVMSEEYRNPYVSEEKCKYDQGYPKGAWESIAQIQPYEGNIDTFAHV